MFDFLSILSLIGVIYLLIHLHKSKNHSPINSDKICLDLNKSKPTILEIDENLQLLKDTISTARLENWKGEIEIGNAAYAYYDVSVTNPQDNIRIKCRLYIDESSSSKAKFSHMAWFHIFDGIPNSILHKGVISYGADAASEILCLKFIWEDHILPYRQSKYDEELNYYSDIKKSIDKNLISLKRDKSLKKILE